MTTPDTQTPDPLPTVRWDEEQRKIVVGEGARSVVLVSVSTSPTLCWDDAVAAIAAALTPSPTPREIADHIDEGGRYEWWSGVDCCWSSIGLDARWWRNRHEQDAPAHGYRLVPLPPAPRWETGMLVWRPVDQGNAHEILWIDPTDGAWLLENKVTSGRFLASDHSGWERDTTTGRKPRGTVPVRQEVPQ